MTGVAQVDSGPWRALGVLPAGKAVVRRQLSNYDSTINTLVLGRVGSNPSNLGMKKRYHYFAPRVGVAYRLKGRNCGPASRGPMAPLSAPVMDPLT
jgi:hypothetical protein